MLYQPLRAARQRSKAPDADRKLPFGPIVAQADLLDMHGAAATFGGGLGKDADTRPRLDHATDGIEAADTHAHSERRPEPGGMTGKMPLQRALAPEADVVTVENVGETHLPGLRQRIA